MRSACEPESRRRLGASRPETSLPWLAPDAWECGSLGDFLGASRTLGRLCLIAHLALLLVSRHRLRRRKSCRQAEVDAGKRPGSSTEEAAELKRLKRENDELKRASPILRIASAFFAAESTVHSVDRAVRPLDRGRPRRGRSAMGVESILVPSSPSWAPRSPRGPTTSTAIAHRPPARSGTPN